LGVTFANARFSSCAHWRRSRVRPHKVFGSPAYAEHLVFKK
jgi:hypothetical protein